MNEIKVVLKEEKDFITLNELLKITGIISTGGQAKWYLQENKILVNNQIDQRRGRKLYLNDVIQIKEKKFIIVKDDN